MTGERERDKCTVYISMIDKMTREGGREGGWGGRE